MQRRGRRRKQLLDYLMEKREHWKLKEEALARTPWRTRFGRGSGPVVRQIRMMRMMIIRQYDIHSANNIFLTTTANFKLDIHQCQISMQRVYVTHKRGSNCRNM